MSHFSSAEANGNLNFVAVFKEFNCVVKLGIKVVGIDVEGKTNFFNFDNFLVFLDLVEIAPTANPHVCRIMDYGKYKFEQMKREKEAKKNQKVIEVKEIRLSLNIDTNDFNTKLNHAIKFLKDGNKVKVSVRFRGREMAHPELGTEMVQKFAAGVAEFGSVDKMPKLEGRSMVMIISSKSGK